MTPDLAAAVDRIALQAGRSAVYRDEAQDAGHREHQSDFHNYAHAYACAAAIGADAGLCDISIALDREWATEELRTRRPTPEQYAARIRAAVEANL